MVTVRQAKAEDGDDLLELIDALADYENLARPDAEARKRLIHDAFEATPPLFTALLAEDELMGMVGYAIIMQTYSTFLAKPTLYLEDLFVRPEGRQSGAGSALLTATAAEAERRGCGRMEWVCLNWNDLAIRFYEKRGAEHLKEWRSYRLTETGIKNLSARPAKNENT